jgi:hypothetical protein
MNFLGKTNKGYDRCKNGTMWPWNHIEHTEEVEYFLPFKLSKELDLNTYNFWISLHEKYVSKQTTKWRTEVKLPAARVQKKQSPSLPSPESSQSTTRCVEVLVFCVSYCWYLRCLGYRNILLTVGVWWYKSSWNSTPQEKSSVSSLLCELED